MLQSTDSLPDRPTTAPAARPAGGKAAPAKRLPAGTGPFSRFEWMLAGRYLRARRREAFISVIAGFSFIGIMLGVATLIIVMAVMNGFRAQLIDKILGLNGHLIVQAMDSPLTDYDPVAQRIAAVPGVERRRVVVGEAGEVDGLMVVDAGSVGGADPGHRPHRLVVLPAHDPPDRGERLGGAGGVGGHPGEGDGGALAAHPEPPGRRVVGGRGRGEPDGGTAHDGTSSRRPTTAVWVVSSSTDQPRPTNSGVLGCLGPSTS